MFNNSQVHDSYRELRLVCPGCPEEVIFTDRKEYRNHMKIHEREKALVCPYCDRKFTKNFKLRDHITTIHEKKFDIECKICFKKFGRKDNLRAHMILHKGKKNFKCEFCDFTAKIRSYVVRHKRVCKNRNRSEMGVNVDDTDRIFLMDSLPVAEELELVEEDYQNLFENQKIFDNDCYIQFAESIGFDARSGNAEEHICPTCYKSFNRPYNLVRHIISVHENYKEAQTEIYCKYCCQILERSDFINHLIFKKYICMYCSKKFVIKGHWMRHEEKCFSGKYLKARCEICHEKCENKVKLKKHMSLVHKNGEITTRTCQFCCQEFKLAAEFHAHLSTHGDIKFCTVCGLGFDSEDSLNDHLEIHVSYFECDLCGYKSQRKNFVKKHIFAKHINKKKKNQTIV